MTHATRAFASIAIAAALAVAPAAAQTAYDSAGTATGTDRSVVFPIAQDHVTVLLMADYTEVAFGEGNPLTGGSGPCFGKLEIRAGSVEGDGHCTWRDRDGEVAVTRWVATGMAEGGALSGDWSLIGGSGKWVGGTGGGTYTVEAPPDTAERRLTTVGSVTLQ